VLLNEVEMFVFVVVVFFQQRNSVALKEHHRTIAAVNQTCNMLFTVAPTMGTYSSFSVGRKFYISLTEVSNDI